MKKDTDLITISEFLKFVLDKNIDLNLSINESIVRLRFFKEVGGILQNEFDVEKYEYDSFEIDNVLRIELQNEDNLGTDSILDCNVENDHIWFSLLEEGQLTIYFKGPFSIKRSNL